MSEIHLVIFDCDGVLMDSEIVAAEAELEIYREFGVEMEIQEFAARFAGKDSIMVKKAMEEDLGYALPDDVVARTHENVNDKCGREAKMVSGADTVLDQLDQARCICSNSPQIRLQTMLGRVGLYDRFRPYVFSAQDYDPPLFKPKPDIINKALEEFGTKPEETIVVEDSAHGIGAAVAAGTRVVGFTGASHTYSTHADELIEAGAETVIRRLNDLPGVVEAFSQWERMD